MCNFSIDFKWIQIQGFNPLLEHMPKQISQQFKILTTTLFPVSNMV